MQTFYEPGNVTRKFLYELLTSYRKSDSMLFHSYELEYNTGTVPNRKMNLQEL